MFFNDDRLRADLAVSPFVMLFSPQRFTHRGAGVCFCHGIEVAVNVGGGAHIAVAEPFLDLLHWNALRKEHRGAGVAQIVESDLSKDHYIYALLYKVKLRPQFV